MKQRLGFLPSVAVPVFALIGSTALMLTGCIGLQFESTDSAESATTAAPATLTTVPLTTSVTDDTATGDSRAPSTTNPAPTTVPTTAVPTTVASPLDCSEFTAATAYDQMLAVAESAAPSDAACADAVAAATAANVTFRKGIELNREFGIGEWDRNVSSLYAGLGCLEGTLSSDVINTFDAPIIVWGVAYYVPDFDASEPKIEAEPFVSGVIAPGATASLDLAPTTPITASAECGFDTRVLVAPVGEFVADAGFATVDADDLQAADDPSVWLPAVRQSEQRFAADPKPDVAVAGVEDVHSPDLVTVLEDFAGGGESARDADGVRFGPAGVIAATAPEVTTAVCAASDVTSGRDEGGQLVIATFTSTSSEGESLVMALFRRGSDARWRYAGRAVTYPGQLLGGTDCANAPALP